MLLRLRPGGHHPPVAAQWSLTYDGENVSLTPSIGNWALPCRSHYWIRKGKVRRSRRYSPAEITENRERDRRRLDRQDAETTPRPVGPGSGIQIRHRPRAGHHRPTPAIGVEKCDSIRQRTGRAAVL